MSTDTTLVFKRIIIVFLCVFIIVLSSHTGYDYDFYCFTNWTINIYKNGLSKAYTIWDNYMPFYQYIMYVFGKLAGSEVAITTNIHYLKILTLLFDVAGLWFVYRWIDKKTDFFVLVLFSMLNIGWLYNTIIWGQVDGIFSMMVFASLYYAYNRKVLLSIIWYVLALNMKLQSIVFFPMLGLISLYHIRDNWKMLIMGIMAAIALQCLLLAPFLQEPNGFKAFWDNVIKGATTLKPQLVAGAFNMWHLFYKEPWTINDGTIFWLGLSYNKIGFILFAVSSFVALWPFVLAVIKKVILRQSVEIEKERVWICCSLLALSFFFFNTQMHERYCHPAFIFITAYAFCSKDFVPYVLFSLAYFLHLEAAMKFLQLANYDVLIFEPMLIASLFMIIMVYLFFRLYTFERKVHSDSGNL